MAEMGSYVGGGAIVLTQQMDKMTNLYAKQLENNRVLAEQKAAKEAKDQEAKMSRLVGDMTKVTSDGVQRAHLPEFHKKYKELEDLYMANEMAKTPLEKSKAQVDFKTKVKEITIYTEQSKAQGKEIEAALKEMQNKDDVYDWKKGSEALMKIANSPLELGAPAIDVNSYRYEFKDKDALKADTEILDGLFKSGAKETKREQVGRLETGYNDQLIYRNTESLSVPVLKEAILARAAGDRNYLAKLNSTEYSGTLDERATQHAEQMVSSGRATRFDEKTFAETKAPVRSSRGGGGDSFGLLDLIGGVGSPAVLKWSGDGNVNSPLAVNLKSNSNRIRLNRNTVAFDVSTGERVDITSTTADGVLTGYATLPVASMTVKKDGKTVKQGNMVIQSEAEAKMRAQGGGKNISYQPFAIVSYPTEVYVDSKGKEIPASKASSKRHTKKVVNKEIVTSMDVIPYGSMTKADKAVTAKYMSDHQGVSQQNKTLEVLNKK